MIQTTREGSDQLRFRVRYNCTCGKGRCLGGSFLALDDGTTFFTQMQATLLCRKLTADIEHAYATGFPRGEHEKNFSIVEVVNNDVSDAYENLSYEELEKHVEREEAEMQENAPANAIGAILVMALADAISGRRSNPFG